MQLRHCIFYVDDAVDYLGEDRIHNCFRWRDIMNTGAVMATGSDYPVVHYNPMPGIFAGLERTQDDGHPEGGWLPDQKVTLPEALKMYTCGSAQALDIEELTGTLEAGKSADIVVMNRNLFDSTSVQIRESRPIMTICAGKTVYEAQ